MKIKRIKELAEQLSKASDAYYVKDKPIMSDKKYDELYDELDKLEKETGYILASSVTQKVQGKILDGFKKVTHSKPMLSAAKTKDINEIKKFIGNNDYYCSYKLDGLTLVTIYEDGKFKQAITRGTGLIGEDVTEQAKMIGNLPMSIPYDGYLELRGECVVSWENFHKINSILTEPYSHPRNLAAGSLRNLDTNITKARNLSYVVFEYVSGHKLLNSKIDDLNFIDYLGFETVKTFFGTVEDCIKEMQPEFYKYPVDGLIFELNDKEYSKSLSATSHHEGCRMALKWADSTHETILRDVIWDVGRSGVISPVAVFDEVDLDGALTTKATLHNLSIIEGLELGIGDTITVYRSNMVIPKIDDNLTRSNTLVIPDVCPCCGHKAEVKYTDNSKFLMCTNPNCPSKLLAKLTHFVSRNCMNIEGLSEATLEFLINQGWIKSFRDIYHLKSYKDEWQNYDGFGQKSVEKILNSIEKSRDVKLENFICALSIPNIGLSASKTIATYFDSDYEKFISACCYRYFDWTILEDFGQIMANSVKKYLYGSFEEMYNLAGMMRFIKYKSQVVVDNPFNGKTLCVTGKLNHFTRDGINAKITELGAKAASSVSKNTDYLITNEASGSSKYKKAVELNVPIITEEEFLRMINATK